MIPQHVWRQAIHAQDACNLSGVVHSWAEWLPLIREELEARGEYSTEAMTRHPINVLMASKVHELCRLGISDLDRYGEAYRACKQQAGEGTE